MKTLPTSCPKPPMFLANVADSIEDAITELDTKPTCRPMDSDDDVAM